MKRSNYAVITAAVLVALFVTNRLFASPSGVTPESDLAEHTASIIKVAAYIITMLVGVTGGLITYIVRNTLKSLQDVQEAKLNGLGDRVHQNEIRLNQVEGGLNTLVKTLGERFLTKDDHDRICIAYQKDK